MGKGHLGIYYNKITLPETLKCRLVTKESKMFAFNARGLRTGKSQ